jgi:hypothetical protein
MTIRTVKCPSCGKEYSREIDHPDPLITLDCECGDSSVHFSRYSPEIDERLS